MLIQRLVEQTTDQSLLEKYQPGPIALLVVVLLGLSLVVLYLSMRRQMKRVDFDETATTDAERAASRHRLPPGDGPPAPPSGEGSPPRR